MNKQGKGSKKRIVALVLCLIMLWSTAIMAYAEGGTYTVKKDDNLKKIAKEVYGNASEWETIYNANKGIIKNPNLIYAGQQLILPGASATEEHNEAAALEADGAAASSIGELEAAAQTPEEMVKIGDMYYDGDGVAQDYAKAMEWYEKAAALGH